MFYQSYCGRTTILIFELNRFKFCLIMIITDFELTYRDSGNTFFIFHNTVSPMYPENRDTKIRFCSLNQKTKTLL